MVPVDNGQTIMLIDDDITALDLIEFLFEQKGYTCERCATGDEALKRLDEGVQPTIFLVDLMMPGMNGVVLISEIRGRGFADQPIFAFTAAENELMHREAKRAGANKVVTKPCPPKELIAMVTAATAD